MLRRLDYRLLALAAWLACLRFAHAEPAPDAKKAEPNHARARPAALAWYTDYGRAVEAARSAKKMLLVFFSDPRDERSGRFETGSLGDPAVRARLADYVCARLPMDATIEMEGQPTRLLQHSAFKEMQGQPGVAVIDFAHPGTPSDGMVVSTFPLTGRLWYGPAEMLVILDLPEGTLTQRTMIYAVRTHPERPASTAGSADPGLLSEAESHSGHQARIRLQGHHQWGARFVRINALLPRGLTAREVCAESWPGQPLVEAAIECVRSWRSSSGHWSAVRSRQQCFGYDMKLGANGVWYATGIFGCMR